MIRFVVRPSNSTRLKVVEAVTQADMTTRLLEYLQADPEMTVYRIAPQGNGDFLLTRIQVVRGSESYEQRLISAEFEDAS